VEPKTIVITGASDGIGAAAARQLAGQGHRVVVVGRSPEKTSAVARQLGADYYLADFARLGEVRELAAKLLANYPVIDVLANNAGGMKSPREETADGHEKTFQVNHLAPFLLTTLLLDRLIASRARVLNTASAAARQFSRLRIDDLDSRDSYAPLTAYGNAKLATILFTKELTRRYGPLGLTSAAFHPGGVATNVAAESGSVMIRVLYRFPFKHLFLISPDRGADTLNWLATARPGTDWIPGEYYAKRKPARTHPDAAKASLAAELWERSAGMAGLTA
jgi:NAD(P)-dependent dehydrogenase (short-subunit alcohol dehydrogenase family)